MIGLRKSPSSMQIQRAHLESMPRNVIESLYYFYALSFAYARPLDVKLLSCPNLSHGLEVGFFLTLPSLVTIGGFCIHVSFLKILKSGLSSSLGGGGLGGALLYFGE
jgi:hypothetical protein